MSVHIEPDVLAERLIKSLVRRDFGVSPCEDYYEHYVDQFTEIVSRMHCNKEEDIRATFHDMVKENKLYQLQEEFEQENVVYWMLVYTFGNNFDLEYHDDGVLINARAQ